MLPCGPDSSACPEALQWEVTSTPPSWDSFLVCLRLNSETWARGVDRGPAANDREAAHAFRGFWGELSELRRFPDGAIVEAIGTLLDLTPVVTHAMHFECGWVTSCC